MSSYPYRPSARPPVLAYVWPLLLLFVALGVLAFYFWNRGDNGLKPGAEPRPITARGVLSDEEQTNIAIYKQAMSSVVHVTNLTAVPGAFNLDVQQIPKGTGTGFIWDEDGHIVTNYHVVQGADSARVTLSDHTTYQAKSIWSYPDKDIAVIWIDAPKSKMRPLAIGTSNDLQVGQITFAIGNPFGLDLSLTTGIVSALGREIDSAGGRPIQGAIQTSAAINPGNSGGPLLDSAGRLIGMNTAILSPSGTFAGIGFAVPVDVINEVVPQLISNGKVVRPRLGVQLAEEQLAQQVGVDKGALIVKVVPNSAAAQAGLRGTRRDANGRIVLGDIIVAVDGKPVANSKDLYKLLEARRVGDTVTLGIIRDGQQLDVKATLLEGS
jgi:S1-C subfamily serine protease